MFPTVTVVLCLENSQKSVSLPISALTKVRARASIWTVFLAGTLFVILKIISITVWRTFVIVMWAFANTLYVNLLDLIFTCKVVRIWVNIFAVTNWRNTVFINSHLYLKNIDLYGKGYLSCQIISWNQKFPNKYQCFSKLRSISHPELDFNQQKKIIEQPPILFKMLTTFPTFFPKNWSTKVLPVFINSETRH